MPSVLGGDLPAFRLPPCPRGATFHVDETEDIKDVGVLFAFADVPSPCISFVDGATVVGNVEALRTILQGRRFFYRARYGAMVAVELA